MPVLSRFPGSGGGSSGVPLPPVTNIQTQPANKRVYIGWFDPPETLEEDGVVYAEWGGTILVRNDDHEPVNKYDGQVVCHTTSENSGHNQYTGTTSDNWFVDSGLTNGRTYYYRFFSYTKDKVFNNHNYDIAVVPNGFAPGAATNVTAVPAGNGKLLVSWNNPAVNIERSGIVVAHLQQIIVRVWRVNSASDVPSGTPDKKETITGTTTTAKTFYNLTNGQLCYVKVFPVSDDGIENTDSPAAVGTADRISIAVPVQNGTLTYDGMAKTASWSNYSSTTMQKAGMDGSSETQTNAGTYYVTFTPKGDYQWNDGTTAGKDVPWAIEQAIGSVTVDPTSVTLTAAKSSAEVEVSGSYDGSVSLSISGTTLNDSPIITAELNGSKINISNTAGVNGTSTVTVSVSGCTNYTTPAPATVTVTSALDAVAFTEAQAGCTYTNGLGGLSGEELNEIARAISDNNAVNNETSEVWVSKYDRHISVGDTISVNIDGSGKTFRVSGFNHYKLLNIKAYGENAVTNTRCAGLLFEMTGCLSTPTRMYAQADADRRWSVSDVYKALNTNNNNVFSTLSLNDENVPDNNLRDYVKPVKTPFYYNGQDTGTQSGLTASVMNTGNQKLFIPSATEVDDRSYDESERGYECVTYAWYKAGNTRNKSSKDWWLRSPVQYNGSNAVYGYVVSGNSGSVASVKIIIADNAATYYVSPCFCI